jgi:hypothetical protein
VKVGLVVAGLLSIDPPLVLPSLFHGSQHTRGSGSFREPTASYLPPQRKSPAMRGLIRQPEERPTLPS